MGYTNVYATEEDTSKKSLRYYFISRGEKDIVKVIDYTKIADNGHYFIFNLAFGDYDSEGDFVIDKVNSNNGDMYPVFHTVLNSVPNFFNKYPKDAIFVQGSDSSHDYFNQCIDTCKKKCVEICKNANRRIKTYRDFINRNFESLDKSYTFYGVFSENLNFTPYEAGI
jgi:hypothetical protein